MHTTPTKFDLEVLESRICPSTTLAFGAILVTPHNPLVTGGDTLIEVTAGKALVYVTDLNDNLLPDIDDIAGISVSGGIKLTSFVNIHGDIVTNLNKNGTLTGDEHDGSVLLAKANISQLDIVSGQVGNRGVLGDGDVDGKILAGGSIGGVIKTTTVNGVTTTLIPIQIDGDVGVIATGTAAVGRSIFADVNASVNGVQIGPVTLAGDPQLAFGSGPSIQGVNIDGATTLSLILAGDGGVGAQGGSISYITQAGGAITGSLLIRAGDGGDGPAKSGGNGGSITNIEFDGGANIAVIAGSGGDGGNGNGGVGGNIQSVHLSSPSGFAITAGNGGHGTKAGGAGGFVTSVEVGSSTGVQAAPDFVLTANFNKDLNSDNSAILDLLTVNSADNSISIFLNDGKGNFTLKDTFSVGTDPQRAAVADINGDGNLDVVVTNRGSNSVSILLGNGDGTFQTATSETVGAAPVGIALAATLDHSSLDIVVANSGDDTVTVLPGRGDGTFDQSAVRILDVGSQPTSVIVAQLNSSEYTDIAVTNAGDNTVSVLLGRFSGPSFQAAQNFDVGANPVSLIAGSFDTSTGSQDLMTANADDNTVTLLSGTGGSPTIHYNDAVAFTVGAHPSQVIAVNLDNSGRLDLVTANASDNTISVLLATGTSSYDDAVTIPVGSSPESVTSGDFNNDGNQDLAVANSGSASMSILFGNGDGTFEVTGTGAVKAGDGGDGDTKNGGAGGFIGIDPSKTTPTDLTPNILLNVQSTLPIIAGSGGNGTSSGGRGGSIMSVEATGGGNLSFQAGNGGVGATKSGGDGGTIGFSSSVFTVVGNGVASVASGSGGAGGTTGGLSGKIVNSQFFGEDLTVTTGDGGSSTGSGQGKAGGDILNSEFDSVNTLVVTTGRGGDSSGSNGATGGSVSGTHFIVTGSGVLSPGMPNPSNIQLTLGDGGAGVNGGAGGDLKTSDFTMNITPIGSIESFDLNELVTRIHTGSGGDGTAAGGRGGNISGIQVFGDGPLLTPGSITYPVDLRIDLGAGGTGGTGAGGDGGSLAGMVVSGVTADLVINNGIFDLQPDPDHPGEFISVDVGTHGRGGDGFSGGAGGSITNVTVQPFLGMAGGTLTIIGGDGGNASSDSDVSGKGGVGGSVSQIHGDFLGIGYHREVSPAITTTTGLRMIGGKGGNSTGGDGGNGGSVSSSTLNAAENEISFIGGDGGSGHFVGGNGGSLMNLESSAGAATSYQAGNGGDATSVDAPVGQVLVGGDGGNINNVDQLGPYGQVIEKLVGGNGGNATGLGGAGGKGGSITGVQTGAEIGHFDGSVFGWNSMGGIFAGAGGQGETGVPLAFGQNGDVLNVTAARIATIVAGTADGPMAVNFVDNITVTGSSTTNSVTTLGANTDGGEDPAEFIFPAFDFHDANGNGEFDLGTNPLHDAAEVPIDGLVLANVIGSINVPARDPSLTLYSVEVSSDTRTGNLDPQFP